MRKVGILLLVGLFACTSQVRTDGESGNQGDRLAGNWHFLDKHGNYNEAFFTDTTYRTINRFVDNERSLSYFLRNDSLYADIGNGKGGMRPIAGILWIDKDHVVISTEFVKDTLSRMKKALVTLQTTDPARDSMKFYSAFNRRYEELLIEKGILTEEEVNAFRESRKVPEDVLTKRRNR